MLRRACEKFQAFFYFLNKDGVYGAFKATGSRGCTPAFG